MANKIFTVAIIGVGARGGSTYGKLMKNFPEKYKITHLCDIRHDRLDFFGKLFGDDTPAETTTAATTTDPGLTDPLRTEPAKVTTTAPAPVETPVWGPETPIK